MSTATDGCQAAAAQSNHVLDVDLTIDLKFTWRNTLSTLLALIEDGDSEGRRFARHELSRMAVAADLGADALLRLSTLLSEGSLCDPESAQLLERAKLATAADCQGKIQNCDVATVVTNAARPFGFLAQQSGRQLELTVCYSARGFYIGTRDEDGSPYSRESVEYWSERERAQACLGSGSWTQKLTP